MKVNDFVSVSLIFDSKTRKSMPRSIVWNNRLYKVTKLGLYHTYRNGENIYHVFSVVANSLFLRLVLDAKTLHWRLEEIQEKLF